MRTRDRILKSLESVYRGAFTAAEGGGDDKAMEQLDLEYQRDQLQLEILLDVRDLLIPEKPDATTSLLEKAQNIRKLTKLR